MTREKTHKVYPHDVDGVLQPCCSVAQSCLTCCDPTDCSTPASLSFTISWSLLLKLMSTEPVMPFNHLILCHPLLLLPSTFPSNRVFYNESNYSITYPLLRSNNYWFAKLLNLKVHCVQQIYFCINNCNSSFSPLPLVLRYGTFNSE